MPHIETDDGIALYYTTDGKPTNPPLVLSNSLGTNVGMWDGQRDPFAEQFYLIRYDTRGHGRSDAPEGAYTMDRLGRDILNLLDALELHTVTWCGLSLGGMLGMWLGVNAPGRVRRIALCNTAAHMPPAEMWDGRIETVRASGMDTIAEATLERWFTAPFRASGNPDIQRVKQMLLATPPAGYAGCCAAIRDMDQREAIAAVRSKVLIVAGRDDPSTPPPCAEEIRERIRDAELVVLDDCAHLSNIEQKEAYNRLVLGFLAADH